MAKRVQGAAARVRVMEGNRKRFRKSLRCIDTAALMDTTAILGDAVGGVLRGKTVHLPDVMCEIANVLSCSPFYVACLLVGAAEQELGRVCESRRDFAKLADESPVELGDEDLPRG